VAERRFGRFSICGEWLRERPDEVGLVFSLLRVVPVRVEHVFVSRLVEYAAYSPAFAPVEEGAELPSYEFVVTMGENAIEVVVMRDGEKVHSLDHRWGSGVKGVEA